MVRLLLYLVTRSRFLLYQKQGESMAKRLRIPKLVPRGSHAQVVTHTQPRPRTSRRSDKERLTNEPWRAKGYDRKYRSQRQIVIEKQQGRCKDCGKQVATKQDDGTWSCSLGGQVHHDKPLSAGGSSRASNLVLLCPSCHYKRDALRRARERG